MLPFLLHFFHKNMEFLWNFGYIKIKKASKVEIKIMESFLFNYIVYQQGFTLTFPIEILCV